MHPHFASVVASAIVLAGGLFAQTPPPCADRLLTISSADTVLREVDPLTGATLASVNITESLGRAISRLNGMARHPNTGTVYVIMHMMGGGGRVLATLDTTTGVATSIGNTGDNFAAITFDNNGTMYGVTGDGGNNPEVLYTIDITNAMATQVMPLGNGNDGESLVFNPRDGLLYHCSGYNGCQPTPGCAEIFESVDPATMTVTNIPLSGYAYTEALGITAIGDSGNFLMADLNDDLCLISDQGFVTLLATLQDGFVRGLVFLPESAAQPFFRYYGFGCPARNGAIAWLTGRGCPTPGQTITLEVLNAPTSAFGLLFLGFGQLSVPLPSAACPVQILPTFPGVVSFTTDSVGASSTSIALPASLPLADFYFQAGVLDGVSAAVVTNPLQTHVR